MKSRRIYQSLRFKITAGVTIPVLIILAIVSYLQYSNHRDLMMDDLRLSASNLGEIIEGSLQHSMLTNDFTEVQGIVDEIAETVEVKDLLLLDNKGRIVISADQKRVGTILDLGDTTCQACHERKAVDRSLTCIFATGQGERIFRNLNPIDNREECQGCHEIGEKTLGVLITDFSMTTIDRHLATDRRNSLLWSIGTVAVVILVVGLAMDRLVVARLGRFQGAIKSLSKGDLDQRVAIKSNDEIGELAAAFNYMTEGLKEKSKLEQKVRQRTEELQAQTERLLALNTIAATVSRSLNLEEILGSALEKVLEVMKLQAGWIFLLEGKGKELRLVVHRGLSEEFTRQVTEGKLSECICMNILASGRAMVLDDMPECARLHRELAGKEGLVYHASVPLKAKDKVLGIMNVAGDASHQGHPFTDDELDLLTAIGHQIGVAIENARLYEELHDKEVLRGRLLEKVITAQEDERKRIARGLHDETGQALTSLMVGLRALEGATCLEEVRDTADQLRATAAQTLGSLHSLALELRPSVLDDLGLVAALKRYVKDYATGFGLDADFEAVGLEEKRLTPQIETTLYRIVQEALTNVARHADASHVSVLLEQRRGSVIAIVEDDGRGFDVESVLTPGQPTRLGLHGMQERASLVGGKLTVESTPGIGTTIFIEIPLDSKN